ncbi:MAG: MSMEG_0567/Sll0786 family nitrogen starvation N-acetyltransferase [Acidimicrobiia bacterium]
MSSPQQEKPELVSPFDSSIDLGAIARSRVEVACRPAATDAERAICAQLRHAVFVVEQSIFDLTDQDLRDADDATIHLIADVGGVAGGTVRIYRLDDSELWKGDRLAVAAPLRTMVIGRRLVQTAVRTAGEMGGHEMVATVQVPNTPFFERLGWRRIGEPSVAYALPHQEMRIGLSGGRFT